ncbi:hypothetical protein GN958_ATG04112 [Phytophthora infestans]|uniref:RxLR effector protein n=1 Tax=Phytophthora infestans TaxID=4787 RepID=A0A8S9V674_PHYIN|nr:hypothetical protein GN958_ATG04112 [Phytophthora infestans]
MRVWRTFIAALIGVLATCSAATAIPKTPITRESSFETTKRFLRSESVKNDEAIDEERGVQDSLEAARIALLKLKIPGWILSGKKSTDVIRILKITYPYVDDKNWTVLKSFQKVHSKVQHSLHPVGK